MGGVFADIEKISQYCHVREIAQFPEMGIQNYFGSFMYLSVCRSSVYFFWFRASVFFKCNGFYKRLEIWSISRLVEGAQQVGACPVFHG